MFLGKWDLGKWDSGNWEKWEGGGGVELIFRTSGNSIHRGRSVGLEIAKRKETS